MHQSEKYLPPWLMLCNKMWISSMTINITEMRQSIKIQVSYLILMILLHEELISDHLQLQNHLGEAPLLVYEGLAAEGLLQGGTMRVQLGIAANHTTQAKISTCSKRKRQSIWRRGHQLFRAMLKIQRTRLDCAAFRAGEIIRVDNAKSCCVSCRRGINLNAHYVQRRSGVLNK